MDARTRRELLARMAATGARHEPVRPRRRACRASTGSSRGIVVRVEFAEWTRDELIRQSAFKGVELDKDPRSVAPRTAERRCGRERLASPADAALRPEAERRSSARRPVLGAGPARGWAGGRGRPAQVATTDELAVLEAMGKGGTWSVGGHEVSLTNLDKVIFPDAGLDEARPDPLRRGDGAGPAALPARPRADPDPLPERHRRPALLGEGGALARPGMAGALALREPQPGGLAHLRRRRSRRLARLPGQPGRHRAAPLDLAHRGTAAADLRAHRHRPRAARPPGRTCSSWRASIGRPSATWACAAIPR